MDEPELQKRLAEELGMPVQRLRGDVWDELRKRGYLQGAIEALEGGWATTELTDLAAEYRAIDSERGGSADRQPPRRAQEREEPLGGDKRSRALARILVEMASCEDEVIAFRREELAGRLLDVTEIVEWIERKAALQQGVRTERIAMPEGARGVPLPASADEYADWLDEVARAVRAQQLRPRFAETSLYGLLAFAGPNDRAVRHVPVAPGSTLDRLRRVARLLAARYQWHEDRAVAFVLSGYEPPLSRAIVTTKRRPIPALDRIAVEVDPRMSAAEVARIYTQQRLDVWQVRDKEMQDKHLALAVFAELHRDGRETWPRLRARWNQDVTETQPRLGLAEPHPKWAYETSEAAARRFASDCRNAWSRVTGLRWRRATEDGSP